MICFTFDFFFNIDILYLLEIMKLSGWGVLVVLIILIILGLSIALNVHVIKQINKDSLDENVNGACEPCVRPHNNANANAYQPPQYNIDFLERTIRNVVTSFAYPQYFSVIGSENENFKSHNPPIGFVKIQMKAQDNPPAIVFSDDYESVGERNQYVVYLFHYTFYDCEKNMLFEHNLELSNNDVTIQEDGSILFGYDNGSINTLLMRYAGGKEFYDLFLKINNANGDEYSMHLFDLSNTRDVVDETSFVESGYNANWCFRFRNDDA